jgi:hypothetical protein
MTNENVTESGWRPVNRQDLIDLIDGGEPPAARFRDTESEPWQDDYVSGFYIVAGGLRYAKLSTGSFWKFCEIKTYVLRDPKFSDLENGPIECLTYTDDNSESPLKAILVGIQHHQNSNNTTGVAYYVINLHDRLSSAARLRWNVKVVDKSGFAEPNKPNVNAESNNAMLPRPRTSRPPKRCSLFTDEALNEMQAVIEAAKSKTDDGWRTPTAEDLNNGPIPCQFRDRQEQPWRDGMLASLEPKPEITYCYRDTNSNGWLYCRIRK